MPIFQFTMNVLDNHQSPTKAKQSPAYETSIDALDPDSARKIGIEKFLQENPDSNLDDYISHVSF